MKYVIKRCDCNSKTQKLKTQLIPYLLIFWGSVATPTKISEIVIVSIVTFNKDQNVAGKLQGAGQIDENQDSPSEIWTGPWARQLHTYS